MSSVSVGVVLRQRGTQLTGIEPAMGCDSGPPLNRNWVVALHRFYRIIMSLKRPFVPKSDVKQ